MRYVIRAVLFLLLIAVFFSPSASASHRYVRFHHYRHHVTAGVGLVTVPTVARIPITVAAGIATKFQDLIADFAEHGYMPKEIGCYAGYGHIPGSRHYKGAACDIDQDARNVTSRFMHSKIAHALIVEHGLRDGCDFGDCGHVDDGRIAGPVNSLPMLALAEALAKRSPLQALADESAPKEAVHPQEIKRPAPPPRQHRYAHSRILAPHHIASIEDGFNRGFDGHHHRHYAARVADNFRPFIAR